MTASYRYDVEILHLLVSPAHAYFGRAREGAADVPTTDADRVELVAGKGIVGDRFFGKAAHMDAAVTLIAAEALEAMAAELGARPFDPLLTRRNVVLRGAQLAPLIGARLRARIGRGPWCGSGPAGLPTRAPGWTRCSPPGAHAAMRGRGGVRCHAALGRPAAPRPGRAGQPRAPGSRPRRHAQPAAAVAAAVVPAPRENP